MILCWAAFIAIPGCMLPLGHRLDTPGTYGHFTLKNQMAALLEPCMISSDWQWLAACFGGQVHSDTTVLPAPSCPRSQAGAALLIYTG